MSLDELDDYCRSLPGCTVRYPFGTNPQIRAWCIGTRMFAWTITDHQPITVQLKADPELIPTLITSYQAILPGYHMNKRHWISVTATLCDKRMLQDLLVDSHQLVADSLPKAGRLSLLVD